MKTENPTTKIYTNKVDVIIIGAGVSGLTSALKIHQKEQSLRIKILEASSTIGGQLCETRLGEIGAKWITEDQCHIFSQLQQLNVKVNRRMFISPNCRRCWDIDNGFFSIFAKFELNRYIRELEMRVQFYRPGHYSYRRTNESMRRHINKRLFFKNSRKFMLHLVQLICGVDDADEVTYTEFMSVCYTCGGLRMLINLYIECPNTLLEFSSNKLLQAYLEKLKYAEILLKRKVNEIRQYKDYVEVCDSECEVHTATTIIMAISWNDIQEVYITPPIPLELRIPSVPMYRNKQMMTSFLAKYKEGYWRTSGFNGNFLSHDPLVVGYEYKPTTFGGLTIHEEDIAPLVRAMTLECLAKHFGDEMLLPIDFYQRTYEMATLLNAPLTTPWHRVIWSSSATAGTYYRGFLSGAVQSGLRAAVHALLMVRPQTVSWQDLAEIHSSTHRLRKRYSSLKLWLSTWNLYNVTYYTIFISAVFTVLHLSYKKRIT